MNRLESIKEREAKATKGPWDIVDVPSADVRITCRPNDPEKRNMDAPICHMRWHSGLGGTLLYEDAHFIAQSRSDIPWLIEKVQEAQRLFKYASNILKDGTHIVPGANTEALINKWLKSLEES